MVPFYLLGEKFDPLVFLYLVDNVSKEFFSNECIINQVLL